jgi:glycosyltransferase involved in cell wall biosynthesis
VVALAAMGTCDILNAQQGALIARDDPADFAVQTLRLLRDAELRKKLSKEGREYIHSWTAGAMAERMLGFYRDVTERHSA